MEAGLKRYRTAALATLLFAVNAALVWPLFTLEYSACTQALDGTFMALARAVVERGPTLTWWPYWNLGIPSTHTYLPLLPWTTALAAALSGAPVAQAYHFVCACCYCLAPVTLFLFARTLSGSQTAAFCAALGISLFSPSGWLSGSLRQDGGWFTLRRLRALVIYGDGPEIMGFVFLPLALLLLHLAIVRRNRRLAALAAVAIAAVALSNAFAAVALAAGVFCLLLCHGRAALGMTLASAAAAYLLACRWLPPSLLATIRANSPTSAGDYRFSAAAALAAILLTAAIAALWAVSPRWPFALRFAALWSALLVPVTVLSLSFDVHLLPQAFRYHLAMELALIVLAACAAVRLPRRAAAAVACVFLAGCAASAIHGWNVARTLVRPVNIQETVDYRVSAALARQFRNERVFAAGSVSFWLNLFQDTPQFHGGHEPFDANLMHRVALYTIQNGTHAGARDAEYATLWLKVYGVHGVHVSGAASAEPYKPFRRNPDLFEGRLPAIWRAGGDTIYRIPQRTPGLAHVVPEAALVDRPPVHGSDVAQLERYAAALDDPALPAASYWQVEPSRASILARLRPGQVVSVQTNYHAGWRATIAGRAQRTSRDGLGLLVIHPAAEGERTIELSFDGGFETTATRWLTALTALALAGELFKPR